MKIKKIAKFDYHSLSSNNVGFFLFFVRLLQGNLLRDIDNKTVIEKRSVCSLLGNTHFIKETKWSEIALKLLSRSVQQT